ncbi:MAG TPA: PQQ-dependent sugar dehydrogenase [Ktedonobacteraceae bacterium]|jgi:glucose/arabinose dehydrogenase|nr:PQQ-dependent sugar dehydrogenase [Ktedonobacteraceae bacterium]
MEDTQQETIPQEQQPPKGWWARNRLNILIAVLITAVVLSGFAYTLQDEIVSLFSPHHVAGGQPGVAPLHVPQGFTASIFYKGLSSPRFIAFNPDGTLFVAERGTGSIVALPDSNQTGAATSKKVVISGLNDPTSLVFYQGALYVGEQTQVTRFTLGPAPDYKVLSRKVIVPNLPADGQHNTRTVLIGPDGKLYVSIGSTCNVCNETDPHRAAIWVYNLDGSGGRLYAKGLRNAVGMAINPLNNQIWVTNNGRDYLGDNSPPETVYALQDGGDYGWPRCHAGDIVDPQFGSPGACNGVVQPLVKMQAHSAPLGLAFYDAGPFPDLYHGLFVAFHGSWNRTVPTGYKVVFIPLNSSGNVSGPVQDFITGWLNNNGNATGRPVGLVVGPDGALYVSDDKGGMIYRISYQGA